VSYQAKPMLVRELNLGEVNHHLYNHLAQLIGSRGNPTVQELLYAQQEQQSILHYLIDTLSIPRQRTSMESVLYGNNPAILIEELVEREKELAVVYDSYSYYLAPYYHLSPSLNRLQYLQKGKLNALQMLGENLGKLKGFLKGADYWLEDERGRSVLMDSIGMGTL
jgi:hypothetical protein